MIPQNVQYSRILINKSAIPLVTSTPSINTLIPHIEWVFACAVVHCIRTLIKTEETVL